MELRNGRRNGEIRKWKVKRTENREEKVIEGHWNKAGRQISELGGGGVRNRGRRGS